jgi:hypothetical protein
MKVYVSDIDKAISCYQPSQSWFGPPKLDPTLITLLKNLRANLGPATDTPLSPADLFNLCKILVSTQEDPRDSAVRKHLENVIGIQIYRVLKSLYQSGVYNAYYFNLVLNPTHKDFSERWLKFTNPDLWQIIDLLTRANILDNPWNKLWDWLTRIDQPGKLSLLRQILERLSSNDVLHIRFFPMFSRSRCLPIDQVSFHPPDGVLPLFNEFLGNIPSEMLEPVDAKQRKFIGRISKQLCMYSSYNEFFFIRFIHVGFSLTQERLDKIFTHPEIYFFLNCFWSADNTNFLKMLNAIFSAPGLPPLLQGIKLIDESELPKLDRASASGFAQKAPEIKAHILHLLLKNKIIDVDQPDFLWKLSDENAETVKIIKNSDCANNMEYGIRNLDAMGIKNYFRKLQDAAEIGLRLISLARYQKAPMFFSVLPPEVIRMIACAGTTYGTYSADEADLIFEGLSNPLQ